jgi:2-polyprenyl-3-methyl-5-hydroxy-6-metoxy-1,4-benzoquinol methylase
VTATGSRLTLLPPDAEQFDALTAWVIEDATPTSRVLDVGAGDGDMEYTSAVRAHVAWVTGVDPSPGIHKNERVDERVEATLEDFSAGHPAEFDLAVISYVVEHVADPAAFLRALATTLRPGATAYLVTPNVRHYFGSFALLAQRLHVDEWLLAKLRPAEVLHEHHFPVQYRMNSVKKIERLAAEAGFRSVEFRMIEDAGIFLPYFPRWLHWFPRWWSARVHRRGAGRDAGTVIARLER